MRPVILRYSQPSRTHHVYRQQREHSDGKSTLALRAHAWGLAMMYDPGRDRDAWATIRGYVYQVQTTIDRWLHLDTGQALELERGEDIDIISEWTAGGTRDEQRLLEQIKHLDRSITLNSDEARSALANFVDQRARNPGVELRFRFVTTASIGRENSSPFPKGVKGIEAWEAIRSGRAAGKRCLRTLACIRSVLRSGPKPNDLPAVTWKTYKKYLDDVRGPALLSLILSFEWSTRQEEPAELRATIEKMLRDQGWAESEVQAREQYHALFAYVFHRLSEKGPKRLALAERDAVLAKPALSEYDRRIIEILDAVMARLEKLEAKVDAHAGAIAQLQIDHRTMQLDHRVMRDSLAHAQDFQATISATELPPDLGLPPGASARARRASTVESIVDLLRRVTWLGIYGTSGSGKTEIALLTAQSAGSNAHWLTLRDTSEVEALALLNAAVVALARQSPGPDRAVWYDALCVQLGRDHVLILDDLPQFEADSALGVQLVRLATAFKRHGLKLLTTSAPSIPQRICARMGDALVQTISVPPFTEADTGELLQVYGAPAEWHDPGRISFINLITEGYAELVVTAATYLRQHDWRFSKDELEELLRGSYASRVESDAMRRLMMTVPDEVTQQLLFRATLFKGSFAIEDVKAIAEVTPVVSSPRGRTVALEGLWLQRNQGARWQVCPLVKGFWSELPNDTQRAVHDAMGLLLVRRPEVSLVEMRHAIDHFVAAKSYNRAGTGLLLVLDGFRSHGLPEYSAGLVEIWVNTPLPDGMDLGMRISLRILQAALRKKEGHSVEWLLGDLAMLADQISDAHSYALFSLLPHVQLLAEYDFFQCSRYLRRAIEVQFSAIMPSGRPLSLDNGVTVEYFVWHQSLCIRSEAHLRDWMRTLQSLSPEQLQRLCGDAEHYEIFCVGLTEQLRHLEVKTPGQIGGWTAVDRLLLDLAKLGEQLQLDLLWASAHRDRIIIRAEHLKDMQGGIELAEQILAHVANIPAAQLLALEAIGRLCLQGGLLAEARHYLVRAVGLQTESYPLLRIYALLDASRVMAPESERAHRYLDEAIDIARLASRVPKTILAQALGERALFLWTTQGAHRAVSDVDAVLQALLECEPEGPEYKEVVSVLGHTMSYLLQDASGNPTPVGRNNEALPKLERGLFLSRNPARVQDYDPARVTAMPHAMVLLADAVGNDELVIKWADLGTTLAEKSGKLGSAAHLKRYLAADRVCKDDYSSALRIFTAAGARIIGVGFSTRAGSQPMLDADLDVVAVLGSRASDRWRVVEVTVLHVIVLFAVFRVAGVWLDDPRRGGELAERLAQACQDEEGTSGHADLWRMTRDIVEASFSDRGAPQIIEGVLADTSVEAVIRVIARICFSLRDGRPLGEVLGDHLAVVSFALRHSPGFPFRQLVTPFVTTYWVKMVTEQPFRFTPPGLAKEEILSAARGPVQRRAKTVLQAVIAGLAIRGVPPDVHAWLRSP